MFRKILIDLDSILDTRLGTLHCNNPEAALDLVTRTEYWHRTFTDWSKLTNGKVTDDEFNQWWAKRGNTELHASRMTNIILVLMKIVNDYFNNLDEGVVTDELALTVNIYPYSLDGEEMDDMSMILRTYLNADLFIEYISASPEEITPTYLHDNYAAMIIWDFHTWIKLQAEALVKRPCPTINVIGPKLFEKDPSALTTSQKADEFTKFKLIMLEMLGYEYVNVDYYCMFVPPSADELEKSDDAKVTE